MAAVAPILSPVFLPKSSSALEPLATGIRTLDDQLGGIPRASLTEISGPASSGRTSLLQSILRTTTRAGQYCVWVDTPDSFDPQTTAQAGVNLSQILWVRCRQQPEHALKAADLLVRAGGFSLLILDLAGQSPRTLNRIPIATWFRLRNGAEQSGTTLIVTSETSQTGSCAKLQLATQTHQILWSQNLLRGTQCAVSSPKRHQTRATISFPFAV
jgi:hypothetical protein